MQQARASILLISLYFFILCSANAQIGDYFLSHHRPDGEGLDNLNFDLAVNDGGLLYIANRSGVLVYDGKKWDFHVTPSAALSIASDHYGDIFVGCVGDYGKIELIESKYQFVSLAKEDETDLFFKTLYHDQQIYFLSEYKCVVYNLETGRTRVIQNAENLTDFTNIYIIDDAVHLQTVDHIYTIIEGQVNLSDFILPDLSFVSFIDKNPTNDSYLIGSEFDNLYIMQDTSFTLLNSIEFVRKNQIQIMEGDWITSDLFALSTLESGCLLFSSSQDALIEEINYSSGLPDNQIYSLVADDAEGLWISHEFGLSRLAPALPVRSFSNYPGIEGNIISVIDRNEELYVATSKGVYYLSTENEYKTSIYYTVEKEPKPAKRSSATSAKTTVAKNTTPATSKKTTVTNQNNTKTALEKEAGETEEEDEPEKKKKGFFQRLKDKVIKSDDDDEAPEQSESLANAASETSVDTLPQSEQADLQTEITVEPKDSVATEVAQSIETEPEPETQSKGIFSIFKKSSAPENTDEDETITISEEREDSPEIEASHRTKKKKGFFSRLIASIAPDAESRVDDESYDVHEVKSLDKEEDPTIFKGRPEKDVRYKRNVSRKLVATNFVFKPIEGIQSKCKQFVEFQGKLLAVCNSGIYNVEEQGELVINLSARNATATQRGDQLLVNSKHNRVYIFELFDNIWAQVDELNLNRDIILNLFQDSNGVFWAASPTVLYEIEQDLSGVKAKYSIPNQYIDDIKISEISGQIYLINTQGYFYLDQTDLTIKEDETLHNRIGKPVKHLQQGNGDTWVYNGKVWFRIDHEGNVSEREHLALFPDMTFIDQFRDKLWVINNASDLYKVDPVLSDSLVFNSRMSLKEVKGIHGHLDVSHRLVLNHDENFITFELARPDYLGLLNVEYQYKMDGVNTTWSDWSSNSKIVFNLLPPDTYTFHVRSRDSFGRILESDPISFTVDPPYWKTVWFSLLQVAVFSSLILFSIILNRRKKAKYALVTQILTVFTIVLIIEFLQNLVQNTLNIRSTPAIDFIVDAGIAFVIFPLEHFLRIFMKEGGSAKIPLFPGDKLWRKLGVIPKKKNSDSSETTVQ